MGQGGGGGYFQLGRHDLGKEGRGKSTSFYVGRTREKDRELEQSVILPLGRTRSGDRGRTPLVEREGRVQSTSFSVGRLQKADMGRGVTTS